MVLNPNYLKARSDREDERTYSVVLDRADTIFAVNYFLGYFNNSSSAVDLMRAQKIVDLKEKNLWDNYHVPFRNDEQITGQDFGLNVYFAGHPKQGKGRRKVDDYVKLLDLTTTHIPYGGFRCTDFVLTLSREHTGVRFIKEALPLPVDEYVLGFIRLDSGVLSNKSLCQFMGIDKLEPSFINAHLLNSKITVPTQPFGRRIRGGKLVALIAQSNELRDFFNERYNTNIVLFYTMSLYGSTKDSSMYDQLDRHLRFIGTTTSRHPLRMKNPHKNNLVDWLDGRGISRFNFKRGDSSAEDKIFRNLIHYLEYCLLINREDPTINKLRKQFKSEIERVINQVERKRVYVGTYGLDNWDDNLINSSREVNEDNNLQNLFDYWKRKVYQRKDWGMRKNRHILNSEEAYHYELLNEQFRDPSFKYVR